MNVNLKIAMLMRGLKQYELANRVGISELEMTKIATGRKHGTPEVRAAIARALKKNVRELWPKLTDERSEHVRRRPIHGA